MNRIIAACAVFFCSAAAAQTQTLTVTPSFKKEVYVPRTEAIGLHLNRELTATDGRLAIFIDQSDLTSLFTISATSIVYRPEKLPLPSGIHQLIVYLVPPQGLWKEIARLPVKVLTAHGFEKATIKPGVDLTAKAQPYSTAAPLDNQPPRETFEDGTVQMTLTSELARSGTTLKTTAQITGVTYENEALRFAQEGGSAPLVDLSSYRVDLQRGSTVLSVGHLNYGSLRHLVNGFSSRGVAVKFGEGRMFSLQLAALNGSSIVGWDNFLGIGERDHRVLGATIGVEMIPTRPGGLRVEVTEFGGSLLPLAAFNQGGVRTAEKSTGTGLHLAASNATQRFTIDSGFTASTFREARDSQVEDGLPVTPIPTRMNTARYADASYVLLQNRMIRNVPVNLVLAAHHERIEPLFRSVGVVVQSDLESNGADLTATLGAVNAQLTHFRSHDNIGEVASILTTKTRRSVLTAAVPFTSIVRTQRVKAMWLPQLAVQIDLTHQFGAGVPVRSGFDASSVPDQMSTNRSASLQWQFGMLNAGYRFGRSNQDNRQPGLEHGDFATTTNGISLGYMLGQRLNVTGELSLDHNDSALDRRRDRTQRYGTTVQWTMFGKTAIGANATMTTAGNNFGTVNRRGTVGFLELSSGFNLTQHATPARAFVRFSDQHDRAVDSVFRLDTNRRGAAISSGVTVSVK